VQILQGENEEASNNLKSLKLQADQSSRSSLNQLALDLAIRRRNADEIQSALKAQSDQLNEISSTDRSGGSIDIPDLVSLVGEVRAKKILTSILLTTKAEMSFRMEENESKETADLARKVMLRNVDRVAWPNGP